METGNPSNHSIYKHALVNQINLEQCILSIRILPDGLSLFIHHNDEQKLWYSIDIPSLGNKTVLSTIIKLWEEEPLLRQNFKNCRVFINPLNSIWVPSTYFSPSSIEVFLNAQIPFEKESQEIKYDFHFSWDAYQVYTVNNQLVEFLGKNVRAEINYLHDLHFVFNYSKQIKSIQKKVFYTESNLGIDLWMLEGAQLKFHQNFYSILSHEDIIFKILTCLEVMDFDFVDDIMYVIGDIDKERYKKLYTYLKTIHQLNYLDTVNFSEKEIKKAPEGALMYRILE